MPCRMRGMKTCLGSLLLVPTLLALVGTVIYHFSVNSELCFEERDTLTEYINVNRSYRPQLKPAAKADKPGRAAAEQQDKTPGRGGRP